MCTITFLARRNGYALGVNRDEKLTRVAALPPSRLLLGGRTILCPSEPNGGTWIGVNDAGVTLALINWYSVPERVAGKAVSRGEVVRSALTADSSIRVDQTMGELSLDRVNPFRLIGVFPASRTVAEWRWNLCRLERLEHRWEANTWISSGFDEPGAQQTRGKTFGEALNSSGSLEWLRRLHRSHSPERGAYSTCMHRDDAATVSYTEVTVSRYAATMRYVPGAPCSIPPAQQPRPLRSPSSVSLFRSSGEPRDHPTQVGLLPCQQARDFLRRGTAGLHLENRASPVQFKGATIQEELFQLASGALDTGLCP